MDTGILIIDCVEERYRYSDEYLDKKGCNFILDKYVYSKMGKEKERKERLEDDLLKIYFILGGEGTYLDILESAGLRDKRVIKFIKSKNNSDLKGKAEENLKIAEGIRKDFGL